MHYLRVRGIDARREVRFSCHSCLQVSFDYFLCGTQFMDVATTSVLPNTTGGQVRHFTGFRRREQLPTDVDLSTAEIDMMVTEATESLCSHVRISAPPVSVYLGQPLPEGP